MTQETLLKALKQNPFVLAPMAGITDVAFRAFMREMGAGIVVTELVSATGLKYSSERTRKLMRFTEGQRPVGIQIFGELVEDMATAAKEIEQMGADFVDLNFGCPVPKVVKRGAGAGMLKDPIAVRNVFRTVKSAIQIPLTVKIRTGWDQESRNAHEVCQIAHDEGLTWVAIHGRTRAQSYAGLADWEYIRQVKANAKIPVLGNGDIQNAETAVRRLGQSGCDGVLIGRGCLKNPWIFLQALQLWSGQDINVDKSFFAMFERLQYHLDQHFDEQMAVLQMKKFCAWFSAGYPDSAKYRKLVFGQKSKADLLNVINDFFALWSKVDQEDTSHEAFLMGGHG